MLKLPESKISKKKKIPVQMTGQPKPRTITTAIHIKRDTWNLLRRVAFYRSLKKGGRASVSKLIEALVDEKREELKYEASKLQNG